MSKNWIAGDVGAGVTIAAAVDAKAKAGDVSHVGSAAADGGLFGYLVTERGTSTGPNAVGVGDGQASVRLIPTQAIVELTVAGTPAVGAPVYTKVGSTAVEYTTVGASTNYMIGHVVTIPGRAAASGKSFVYLGSATGAKGA